MRKRIRLAVVVVSILCFSVFQSSLAAGPSRFAPREPQTTATPEAVDAVGLVQITQDGVTLTATADKKGYPHRILKKGDVAEQQRILIGADGDWWRYINFDGIKGYVPADSAQVMTREEIEDWQATPTPRPTPTPTPSPKPTPRPTPTPSPRPTPKPTPVRGSAAKNVLEVQKAGIARLTGKGEFLEFVESNTINWLNLRDNEIYSPYLRVRNTSPADVVFQPELRIDNTEINYSEVTISPGYNHSFYVIYPDRYLTKGSHTMSWYINGVFLTSTVITVSSVRATPTPRRTPTPTPRRIPTPTPRPTAGIKTSFDLTKENGLYVLTVNGKPLHWGSSVNSVKSEIRKLGHKDASDRTSYLSDNVEFLGQKIITEKSRNRRDYNFFYNDLGGNGLNGVSLDVVRLWGPSNGVSVDAFIQEMKPFYDAMVRRCGKPKEVIFDESDLNVKLGNVTFAEAIRNSISLLTAGKSKQIDFKFVKPSNSSSTWHWVGIRVDLDKSDDGSRMDYIDARVYLQVSF